MRLYNLLAQLRINPGEIGYNSAVTSGDDGLERILNLVYMWAGIIAVLIIIIAGILFVTSRGDAAQIKRSKDAIRAAVIGLIVVLVAFVITRFIIGGVQG